MSDVSLSKSALLLSPCLRWAGPEGKPYDESRVDAEDHTKRDRGIAFHSCMEHYGRNGHALRALEEAEEACVREWAAKAIVWVQRELEPRLESGFDSVPSMYAEVYVSYNFATGEVHTDPKVRNRAYPKMPGLVPGTADLVCVLATGELLVGDWKTGGGVGADKQLLSLAAGLRRVYTRGDGSYRPVRLAILYAGEAAYGAGGVVPVEWAVTESDIVAHEHAMAFQLADVATRKEPVVGSHCTQLYCPHLAYCPGITAIVEDQSRGSEGLLSAERLLAKMKMTDNPISDEEAGYTMERIAAARRQMKYLEAGVRKYIEDGGKALAGDFEFKSTNSGFRWVKRNG